MDSHATIEELKNKGNESFILKKYAEADRFYTEAILMCSACRGNDDFVVDKTVKSILLTNRSAARFNLDDFINALIDAEKAIDLNPRWTKSYYRRATTLKKLGREREAFETWQTAVTACDQSDWLDKQLINAKKSWGTFFLTEPIVSLEDLLNRYKLLDDRRERLSTLAHFWNDSQPSERLDCFKALLSIIGGVGEQSEENKNIGEEIMIPMPLENYQDLPRDRIATWCAFYKSLSPDEKTSMLVQVWLFLRVEEQDAIIEDLRVFVANQHRAEKETGINE